MILDFQQNGAVVLTTQDPGAFINFRWESGDPSYYLIPEINSIESNKLWINGLDISQDASIYDPNLPEYFIHLSSDGDTSIASFFLYTRELSNFDTSIVINIYSPDINTLDSSVLVSVINRPYIIPADNVNIFETSNVQVEGDTSYLVLRTNPKFSGNIKLVTDTSNNLYLDTFKVSDILSNKLYRKQKISSNSVFSSDVRKVFSSLPLGEMYRLDAENTLSIGIPKTELYDQYNVTYSYGARLFEDELYDDDYSLLAPLWINNTLPDYFAIFRVDGVFNEETYPEEGEEDLSGLANKYISQGELIKSWGLKEDTYLGDYLRNHLTEISQNISPMFLSLSDPDSNLKDPDPNTWYGIAVDKGIITGRSETTYFFDQKSPNFTDLNAFSSGGFERLNLLCPNLVNMEYVFSDSDVSLYTMNRYFGLYLTENPLYEIAYYANNPDGSINIISLDGNDSENFFNSDVFNSDGSIISSYENRLFTLDDLLSIKRITNIHQVDGTDKTLIEEWLNKPGDNIFSVEVENIDNLTPFISFEIQKKLQQGEHLRIIDITDNKIWEIYGTNSDLLNEGESLTYATTTEKDSIILYRTCFSTKGDIENQNTAIWNAWKVFSDYNNTPFAISKKKETSQSILILDWAKDHVFKFQRLTSQTTDYIFDPSTGLYDSSSPFNSVSDYSDIQFYGIFNPGFSDFERVKYDSLYGPIDFEIFGDRMSLIIDIFNPAEYNVYSMEGSIKDLFLDNMLYLSSDNWYRLIQYFDVSTALNNSLRYMEDPISEENKIIVISEESIITTDKKWNAYAVYPLTISLMGINPVKDFDYTVYDSSILNRKSEYWYKREGDASTFNLYIETDSSDSIHCINSYKIINGTGSITIGGETETYSGVSPLNPFVFNTFDCSAIIESDGSTLITLAILDGSASFKSYKDGKSEESIWDYYQDSSILLKYGLTAPYITKWSGIGNDCRNNPIRLILDSSILDVSTNFIPYENSFDGELFYPSFKYLTPGVRNWEDYIFYDINDSIKYTEDSSIYYSSFKELMLSNPYIDVFSKLVYSNHNVDGTKLRSSIAYYNNYKNTIDTIVNGLNISFKIEESAKNIIDIQDWDRFRISTIAVPSRNRDNNYPMEVFINENTETILLVWYQGNDILNYNYRNSSTMPGKGVLDPDGGATVEPIQWRGFNDTNKYYSHVKTPFAVNNASLSSNIFNIYGISNAYDGSIASPYMQNNLNFGDNLFSIFNAYDNNEIIGGGFEFYSKSYNTFREYVDYNFAKSESTYGDLIANMPYSYMKNENLYLENTCDLDTLKNIFDYGRIGFYIYRDDTLYANYSFSTSPIKISINSPRKYRDMLTYNGWYKPKFHNILEFSYNEDREIITAVEKDFTFSNTNVKSYKNIPQLWYNKVVEEVNSYDVSMGNAIDYANNWNPFKSQWDSNYYYLYNQGVKSEVDGYNSTLELPSYFGSKLIRLPNQLDLDNWSSSTTNEEIIGEKLILTYNLTRNIVNIFKTKENFINNWSNLDDADNIIDGYIKKTVLNYYNISQGKIGIEIWSKPLSGEDTRLAYTLDNTFTKWSGANVNGLLNYINNEYVYKMTLNISPNRKYFVKFSLFEK